MRRASVLLAMLVVLSVFGGGSLVLGQQAGEDRGVLANLLSRALSTPATRISIGAVEGALSSDATIRNVTVSDRDGVAIHLDRARIVWRRTALLQRRLEIELLEVDRLEVLRLPLPSEEPVPGEDQPLLPELPVEIRVQSFRMAELALGDAVAGIAAKLSASGSASLGEPSAGLSLTLNAVRLDGAGSLGAELEYRPDTAELRLAARVSEPEGGLLARVAALPGLPPVRLDITGRGPLDAFEARLDFAAGLDITARGTARTVREAAARRLDLDLAARIGPWLPPAAGVVFADETELTGGFAWRDDGGYDLRDLTLRSAAAVLVMQGGVDPAGAADVSARLRAVPGPDGRTKLADGSLGTLSFEAKLLGNLSSPTVTGDLRLRDLKTSSGRLGEASARLSVVPSGASSRFRVIAGAEARDLVPSDPALARALGSRAALTLRADIGPGPAVIELLGVETPVMKARFSGDAGARRLDGVADFTIADLAPLSDLAGRRLAGKAEIRARLTGNPVRSRIAVDLDGGVEGLRAEMEPLERLIGPRLALSGTVTTGPRSWNFRELSLKGRDIVAVVDGRTDDRSHDLAARITAPDLSRADRALSGALRAEARLSGSPERPEIAVDASLGKGRIALSGAAGEDLDLSLEIENLSLGTSVLVAPAQGLRGRLDASARITGPRSAPEGPFRFAASDLTTVALRSAGLPAMSLTGECKAGGGRASIDARLAAGALGDARIQGSIPLNGEGRLDLKLPARIEAGALSGLLGAGRRFTGRIAADIAVTGTPAAPIASGDLSLSNGSFRDPVAGVRLDAVTLRLAARGERIVVERASAVTPGGGSLSASGSVRLDIAAGLPADLRITGRRARLVDTPAFDATGDLDLTVTGPVLRAPKLAGRVGIASMNIRVPERTGAMLQPLPGTRHVGAPPRVEARLARQAKLRKGGSAAFAASLDLLVDAPGRIYVRGRGVDAELGGRLRLTGTSSDPVPVGGFDLRRGSLSVLSQRLEFTRGRALLTGDLVPTLDLEARANSGAVTVRILITGRADEPAFDITSEPELPQEEALSRLLFQRPTGSLSPFQAVQLADAVASFGGGGPLEGLRRSLGLDSLDIVSGTNGPGAALGRAVGERARVGIRTGATPETTGVTLDVDLTRRIRLRGEADATGGTAAGIAAEWEW